MAPLFVAFVLLAMAGYIIHQGHEIVRRTTLAQENADLVTYWRARCLDGEKRRV